MARATLDAIPEVGEEGEGEEQPRQEGGARRDRRRRGQWVDRRGRDMRRQRGRDMRR